MIRIRLPRLKAWERRALGWSAAGVAVALTLLPLLVIATILTTTGANNLSSDDGNFITKFVDKVFAGTYHWQDFPRDTFFNTHSLLFPGLIYLGVAYFADFNVYVTLYIGLLLGAVKVVLLHGALTRTGQGEQVWERWLFLPMLSALVFSVSQVSSFEHGLSTLAGGLSWLGFALGLWALTGFPRQWRAVVLMSIGGVIATLSSGTGLIMWPIFLVSLIWLGFRKVGHYVIWLGSAVFSASPYFVFLYLKPLQINSQVALVSLFNYWFVVDALGRPFSNRIGIQYSRMRHSIWIGLLGIALCSTGLSLLALSSRVRRKAVLARSCPALMLIALSLLTTWQFSLFRDSIAPWYTSWSVALWIGLLGLAYVLWTDAQDRADRESRHWQVARLTARLWSIGIVTILVVLYASSNITYTDKALLLKTRSPASAACLRNYKTAPTHCEESLVIWQPGDPGYIERLARPLERHHLSVFAPHQQWTLQGDFILDNVQISEQPGIPDIHWSADLTSSAVSFRDFRHLNLFLHTPNSIYWNVTLPANTERADFFSAIAISESVPFDSAADGARFEVYLKREGVEDELVFSQSLGADQHQWHPFAIPLTTYAGQTITLRLTSSPGSNTTGDWAMYRYPYIDLKLDTSKDDSSLVPANRFLPTLSSADERFYLNDPRVLTASNMQPMPEEEMDGSIGWILDSHPSLRLNGPLDLRLADYSHFYVRLAAEKGYSIALQIAYELDHEPASAGLVKIPLYADGEMHEYTYDLKLLELDQQRHLTGVELHPVCVPSFVAKSWIRISDFRLLRKGGPINKETKAQSRNEHGPLNADKIETKLVADLIHLAKSFQSQKEAPGSMNIDPLVRVSSFEIEGTLRNVLFMHPTSSLTYHLQIPDHARFEASLALDPRTWEPDKGDGVEYTVYIKGQDGRSRKLLDRYIDPKNVVDDRKWHDLSIDLGSYAGQRVALTLATLPGPAGDTRYDWAGWATPRILTSQTKSPKSRSESTKIPN